MNRKRTAFDEFSNSSKGQFFWASLVVFALFGILFSVGYSFTHTYTVFKSVETREIVQILDWRGRDVTDKVDPDKISYDGVSWVK